MKLELLPAVDVLDGRAVRVAQGEAASEEEFGQPREIAHDWLTSGAEWIHLVDLDAAFGRGSNQDVIAAVIQQSSNVKIELSGGIRDNATLESALAMGATRVVLSTSALADLDWTASAIDNHGAKIAIGLDVQGSSLTARGSTQVVGDLFEVLQVLEETGCARYVVTDVTKDGTLLGPNLELLRSVLEKTNRPVVASGGISSLEDLQKLKELTALGLEGAILGKSLYAGRFTLKQALKIANG